MLLERIVTDKKQQLEVNKRAVPLAEIEALAKAQQTALDFAGALKGDRVRLIAEIKKASPSCGVIRADFEPVAIAEVYCNNGASAISVLTESAHFQGCLDYLETVKKHVKKRLPVMRKDFIIEPYQVYESRAAGADALLLIVAILTPGRLKELLWLSHALGMTALVEVHDAKEVDIALSSGACIIGINNRDLDSLRVDIDTTMRLRPLIPADRIVVSESGIREQRHMQMLADWRVDAGLVGEALMSAPDIAEGMRKLLDQD
jgi:indole-3-glycerol phosphate synthase